LADWLVEQGIAEHRAVRMASERIVEARIEWPDRLAAGWVIEARLIARSAGSSRGCALADSGEELLVDRLPREAREGARLRLHVTRAALDGPGRLKRPQARPSEAPLARPGLAERLGARLVHRFPGKGWNELIDEALSGEVSFPAGTLLFGLTAAMTTVDIDGTLSPRLLALAAAAPLASALRRLDVGGSVAVDFPTLPARGDRRAVDEALGEALAGWPHERTAMNGFGLVQLVARLERPSLLQLAAWQRSRLVWRRLLRRAEMLPGAGLIELTVHPALECAIEPGHLAELERRCGARVELRSLPTVALDAPHAQRIANA
jgi:hypothetical protein